MGDFLHNMLNVLYLDFDIISYSLGQIIISIPILRYIYKLEKSGKIKLNQENNNNI